MKKKRKRLLGALTAVLLLVSAAGITFSVLEIDPGPTSGQEEVVKIVLMEMEQTDSSLSAKSPASQAPYIENVGRENCYVRVRLEIPQVEGQPLLQVGEITGRGFQVLNFTQDQNQAGEYWEQKGEYIYYRNKMTKNQLKIGKSTTTLYTMVRITPELSGTALEVVSADQSIVMYAEAVSAKNTRETEAWSQDS